MNCINNNERCRFEFYFYRIINMENGKGIIILKSVVPR